MNPGPLIILVDCAHILPLLARANSVIAAFALTENTGRNPQVGPIWSRHNIVDHYHYCMSMSMTDDYRDLVRVILDSRDRSSSSIDMHLHS